MNGVVLRGVSKETAEELYRLAGEWGLSCRVERPSRGHPRVVFQHSSGKSRFVVIPSTSNDRSGISQARRDALKEFRLMGWEKPVNTFDAQKQSKGAASPVKIIAPQLGYTNGAEVKPVEIASEPEPETAMAIAIRDGEGEG